MKKWFGSFILLAALAAGSTIAEGQSPGQRRLVPLLKAPNPTGEAFRVAPPAAAERTLKGLAKAGATVTVNFLPAGPQGSDTCIAWDPTAQAAFSFAANIWGSLLQSAVPIHIDACWCNNLPGGVLGHAGPDFVFFNGAFYPAAIANAISGVDQNGGAAEIYAAFNSTESDWYFGTDSNVPFVKYDFVSVLLHEFGHGLGFTGSMEVSGGSGDWGGGGIPLIFDTFNENGAGQSLTNTGLFPHSSAALAAQLQSGSVFWNGANGIAANGATRPKLYAPNPFEDGSSISHLDFATYQLTANGLMIPALFNGIAIHSPGPITLGIFKDMGWPLAAAANAELQLTQTATPTATTVGKDVMYTMTIRNNGPDAATSVEILTNAPAGAAHIWSSPGCVFSAGALTCTTASLASGATKVFKTVMRPTTVGTATNAANVASAVADSNMANNLVSTPSTISAAPAAVQMLRYRLYSPVTKEHHFTTDLNEYNVLGTFIGTWVQEGTVGKVLNNPGSFNAVAAVPYYRLYDTSTQWHHWTTDANEYYTLSQVFAGWNAEGVDGYILPSATAGTVQLFRLNYPALGALHHWTIDANEYNTLITPAFGWVGEGGSGFVIQ